MSTINEALKNLKQDLEDWEIDYYKALRDLPESLKEQTDSDNEVEKVCVIALRSQRDWLWGGEGFSSKINDKRIKWDEMLEKVAKEAEVKIIKKYLGKAINYSYCIRVKGTLKNISKFIDLIDTLMKKMIHTFGIEHGFDVFGTATPEYWGESLKEDVNSELYYVYEEDTGDFVGDYKESNPNNGDVIPKPKEYTEYKQLGFVDDDDYAAHFTKEQAEEVAKDIQKAYGSKIKIINAYKKLTENLNSDKIFALIKCDWNNVQNLSDKEKLDIMGYDSLEEFIEDDFEEDELEDRFNWYVQDYDTKDSLQQFGCEILGSLDDEGVLTQYFKVKLNKSDINSIRDLWFVSDFIEINLEDLFKQSSINDLLYNF